MYSLKVTGHSSYHLAINGQVGKQWALPSDTLASAQSLAFGWEGTARR